MRLRRFYAIIHIGGDCMKNNKKLFIIFLSVFVLFLVCFFAASAMVQNGIIPNVEFSSSAQSVFASITFLPLIVSIFFLGQHLKNKSGIWQNIYKALNFISIALFCYMIIIIIFSFLS